MQLGVRFLEGELPYEPVWQAMKAFTDSRDENTQDEVWILQHQRVFTQGQAGKPEHLLFTGDIPVVQADRGGQVTYHGPGQITAYIMADLKRLDLGPRTLVDAIETSLVKLLALYDIEAFPKADAPGVYVGESKIASLGLRIRKGYSFHGLALNVDMDLEPFLRINPCGYAGMNMTQMADHTSQPDIKVVGQKLVDQIATCLPYEGTQELGHHLP
ncbi:lipoyl(octanoyl) transferase LipB [Bermanella sp. WJH001]|uniref:lipoyl(octanoyl) transferase LipB n=1 Tax=Bermanella sp. WJH001 TaxID=3048005 RepID=UPI0024BDAC9F|nr:lipoyl(octanoyl) transferase LipB [Bermanella sp. WJH001]MDJ1539590.1 lipoyl(octanoyl) transferase LipB [Bermanella sp. WJH001]